MNSKQLKIEENAKVVWLECDDGTSIAGARIHRIDFYGSAMSQSGAQHLRNAFSADETLLIVKCYGFDDRCETWFCLRGTVPEIRKTVIDIDPSVDYEEDFNATDYGRRFNAFLADVPPELQIVFVERALTNPASDTSARPVDLTYNAQIADIVSRLMHCKASDVRILDI